MLFLSLRFIGHEHQFNYRLALEIGLIIALAISVSGAITGVSSQFNTLLSSTSGEPTTFIGVKEGSSLEKSTIPLNLYDSIDNSFINYKIPFLVKQVVINPLNNALDSYIYYTNLSDFFKYRKSFFIHSGTVPRTRTDLLIGEGLASQLGQQSGEQGSLSFPFNLSLQVDNSIFTRTVTGIFKDSGPWNFAFIGNFSRLDHSSAFISGFEFQLKNRKVFTAFKNQVSSLAKNMNIDSSLDYLELKQVTNLSNSFLIELTNLFNYLLFFLFLLLILKLLHASIMLFNRLKKEYMICKLIGMDNLTLQRVFYYNLTITGNIGLVYGVLLGITLPQILVILLKLSNPSSLLNLLPNPLHIMQIFIIANAIFLLTSLWITASQRLTKI